jgi:putative membrane protein
MLYEVFEWLLSVFLSPDQAEAYNGQQGDMWDPQKDMALAMLGAILMILILKMVKKKSDRNVFRPDHHTADHPPTG